MDSNEGTLLTLLTGGTKLKRRVQHPRVQECTDYAQRYWFFRYYDDEIQPDGTVKTTRKRHIIGPSRGKDAIKSKDAEDKRDAFFQERNKAATRCEAAAVEEKPPEPGDIIFGKLAELWRTKYVEGTAAGKPMIAKPTREVYRNALDKHILDRWKDTRLKDLRARDVLEWLQEEAESWWMMAQLRGVMSGIITKAVEWEILPETFGNPIERVKLPKKWTVRERRILTEEQTAWVLANLEGESNLLICETCLDTGTRISEVLGLMDQSTSTLRRAPSTSPSGTGVAISTTRRPKRAGDCWRWATSSRGTRRGSRS
jgi:hypothetical protein